MFYNKNIIQHLLTWKSEEVHSHIDKDVIYSQAAFI